MVKQGETGEGKQTSKDDITTGTLSGDENSAATTGQNARKESSNHSWIIGIIVVVGLMCAGVIGLVVGKRKKDDQ